MSKTFHRPLFEPALARLAEPRHRLQVLAGPRQVGKTTLALQLRGAVDVPAHYASADDPALRDRAWLIAQWEAARSAARANHPSGALLIIDEIQKVGGWSETVKSLWDEDTRIDLPLKVLLLGSSALLVHRGLSESLTGRFELIRAPHWSFAEMHAAFGFSLDEFVYFGGYPGAADLIGDEPRWAAYVLDAIVETTISRDVLLLNRVDKPALLRSLFRLACDYTGQIVSYQKLVGQLQDAGNTTTLAHYLDLLATAGVVAGLEKYASGKVRQRRSSPKLLALNTALASATRGVTFEEARADRTNWGRLVETAVGAHMANRLAPPATLCYWRERGREVDFVIERGDSLLAVEVKAGLATEMQPGLRSFLDHHPGARPFLVGGEGTPIDEFLGAEELPL